MENPLGLQAPPCYTGFVPIWVAVNSPAVEVEVKPLTALITKRNAMEEEFFAKQDKELVASLHRRNERTELKAYLTKVLGIQDEEILDELLDLGFTAESTAALGLIPLVEVAWADADLDSREKKLILEAARQQGIHEGSSGYRLLAGWLERQPSQRLFTVWDDYLDELRSAMPEIILAALRQSILVRAAEVAKVAGSLLGLTDPISSEEKRVLARLTAALE